MNKIIQTKSSSCLKKRPFRQFLSLSKKSRECTKYKYISIDSVVLWTWDRRRSVPFFFEQNFSLLVINCFDSIDFISSYWDLEPLQFSISSIFYSKNFTTLRYVTGNRLDSFWKGCNFTSWYCFLIWKRIIPNFLNKLHKLDFWNVFFESILKGAIQSATNSVNQICYILAPFPPNFFYHEGVFAAEKYKKMTITSQKQSAYWRSLL